MKLCVEKSWGFIIADAAITVVLVVWGWCWFVGQGRHWNTNVSGSALISNWTGDDWLENSSSLYFEFWESFPQDKFSWRIEVTGTTTGAIATVEQNERWNERWMAEIDKDEWHDFLRSFYSSGVIEWKRYYKNLHERNLREKSLDYGKKRCMDDEATNHEQWELTIASTTTMCASTNNMCAWGTLKNTIGCFVRKIKHKTIYHNYTPLVHSRGENKLVPDWDTFQSKIGDFKAKIMQKSFSRHDAEYKKRFGVAISTFERSMREVFSYNGASGIAVNLNENYWIGLLMDSVSAVGDQIYTEPNNDRHRLYINLFDTELNISDWLDVVNAIGGLVRECGYDELLNYELNQLQHFKRTNPNAYYPPAWDKFNKVMSGIRTNIKKNSGVEVLELKLKEEYQKKYGTDMSDFESSITNVDVRFYDDTYTTNDKYFQVRRTMNGAVVTMGSSAKQVALAIHYGNYRVAELDIDEWLYFVRMLHKIHTDKKWNEFEKNDLHKNWVSVSGPRRFIAERGDFTFFTDGNIIFYGCGVNHSPEMFALDTSGINWDITIDVFDKRSVRYAGGKTHPPNWEDFSRLMTGLEARVTKLEVR